MHAVVMESLEEYLSGLLEPAVRRRIETHLNECASCRAGMDGMAGVSRLFGALRSQECDPAPGFYARVVERIETTSPAPSFAGLFAFDLVFARRLAFSCMLTLAVLGSFLVSRGRLPRQFHARCGLVARHHCGIRQRTGAGQHAACADGV